MAYFLNLILESMNHEEINVYRNDIFVALSGFPTQTPSYRFFNGHKEGKLSHTKTNRFCAYLLCTRCYISSIIRYLCVYQMYII